MNKFVNGVVGDWQLSGIASFHGGFPMTITAGDNSGTGSRGARANCDAPLQYSGRGTRHLVDISGSIQVFTPLLHAGPLGTAGSERFEGRGSIRWI